jgi:hypothetical protein
MKNEKTVGTIAACLFGLSATSQQCFPLRTNQPAVLFSQNKSAPATSHQPNEQAEETPYGEIFVIENQIQS